MSIENGDMPAMPQHNTAAINPEGLTKRELFAAMAMQGLCANPHAWDVPTREIARFAAEQADSQLAELAKKGAP